jgi:hypothetical protein
MNISNKPYQSWSTEYWSNDNLGNKLSTTPSDSNENVDIIFSARGTFLE